MTAGRRVVLFFFVLLAMPAAGFRAEAGLFNPVVYKLENGLQIVVIEDHRAPVVSHMVWYKVGAADEPPGKSGIAHFLEHLMFKGTETVPAGEFSRIVARNGGRENAFTSQDFTGYFQNVARDKLELVMRLEADRMANLRLAQHDVDTERDVILEERRSRTDNDPSAQMNEMMQATLYLASPYGTPVIGWEHEIRGLTRQDALDFYARHYTPNDAILLVAGDVTGEEVLQLARKYYGAIPSRPVPPRLRPTEPPQLVARRLTLADERIGHPSFRRSYLAPSLAAGETRLAMPLDLFSEILGGSTVSRLYQELVVKRKLAVSAGCWYSGTALDQTHFVVYASPAGNTDLPTLEKAVDEVLADVLANGITEAELVRARNSKLASTIYMRDNMFNGPRVFGDALTSGLSVEDVERWPERIVAVTADEVMEAARSVLDLRRSVTGYMLPKE